MKNTIRTDAKVIRAVRTNYGWAFYETRNGRQFYIGNQAADPIELPSCEKINQALTPFGRHVNVTVMMVDEYFNSPNQNGNLPWSI